MRLAILYYNSTIHSRAWAFLSATSEHNAPLNRVGPGSTLHKWSSGVKIRLYNYYQLSGYPYWWKAPIEKERKKKTVCVTMASYACECLHRWHTQTAWTNFFMHNLYSDIMPQYAKIHWYCVMCIVYTFSQFVTIIVILSSVIWGRLWLVTLLG